MSQRSGQRAHLDTSHRADHEMVAAKIYIFTTAPTLAAG